MDRKISVNVALAITLIAMTVTFAITWMVSSSSFSSTVTALNEKQAQFTKLADIDTYVRGNYYGNIEEEALNDRLARGYLDGTGDKNATYYSATEYTEKQRFDSQELVGVGLEVIKDNVGFYITKVYDDSPAARAGVQQGGYITFVEDVDTKTVTSVPSLRTLLRGEQGTTLRMSCMYGAAETREFEIQRVNYVAKTMESIRVDNDYEYIRIFSFGPNSAVEFNHLVTTALNDNVKGFVFDVRGNVGNQHKYAYEMIDLLCPRGTIAKSENKANLTKVLATSDENAVDLPMVVLVNGNTAGVAELFAHCVRDMAGGQIIGTKTAGWGTIQSDPQKMSDGSAVSVTVAKLLCGNNESFDGVGIEPNAEVLLTNEESIDLYNPDPRTDTQILRSLDALRIMGQTSNSGTSVPPSASSAPASDESTSTAEG